MVFAYLLLLTEEGAEDSLGFITQTWVLLHLQQRQAAGDGGMEKTEGNPYSPFHHTLV